MRILDWLTLPVVLLWLVAASDAAAQGRRRSLGKAETLPLRVQGGLDRPTLKLGELSDRPLVLYVYDGTCSDCREHLAYLRRLQQSVLGTVVAVEVVFGNDAAARTREADTGKLISVADVDGALWTELLGVEAVESPPGGRAKAQRVLPVTLFVGQWIVRDRGSVRQSIDTYVRRRTSLMMQVAFGRRPSANEVDLEDDALLAAPLGQPPVPATRAVPRRGAGDP